MNLIIGRKNEDSRVLGRGKHVHVNKSNNLRQEQTNRRTITTFSYLYDVIIQLFLFSTYGLLSSDQHKSYKKSQIESIDFSTRNRRIPSTQGHKNKNDN